MRSPAITIDMLMRVEKDKESKNFYYTYMNKMMQCADLGIYGIKIKKGEIAADEIDFGKIEFPNLPEEISEQIRRNLKGKIEVEFTHRAVPTGKDVHFSNTEESEGTRRFFELAGPWLLAILEGMTLLVDEVESSLHPHLVRELINVVQKSKVGKTGAQLIFATHDTTLLDPELFRRDQIWFTEKDKHGSTRLYSMLDYKPRKSEAMQKGYLTGRYGAIPIIEAFELNGK
jgi:AAA15 family ATPase/GTPase